eukprot:CAMPEP_0117015782 /NCGR_PEP_ID=MMETSP0472-20121206/12537_1 /TAXON_ID=693140 ORGANISM="Tiarina fusus, Strain LIS" /NCGR_SAMPLE_ID=MMETSP0472 /ASSEMBLY_ACC=CAM_ASM_000603 /LENGTH=168 /DNA_ID=CAMNT_0004719645 /DNA_START=152 /DNA_END=658 /DNA_ORIENTATION=-
MCQGQLHQQHQQEEATTIEHKAHNMGFVAGATTTATDNLTTNNTPPTIIDKAIDNALEHLKAAQQDISTLCAVRESVSIENTNLVVAVDALKEEKRQLESEIERMKLELNDLGDQLTETQDEILQQAYTTNRASEAGVDHSNDDDDNMPLDHDDSQETVLHDDTTTTT